MQAAAVSASPRFVLQREMTVQWGPTDESVAHVLLPCPGAPARLADQREPPHQTQTCRVLVRFRPASAKEDTGQRCADALSAESVQFLGAESSLQDTVFSFSRVYDAAATQVGRLNGWGRGALIRAAGNKGGRGRWEQRAAICSRVSLLISLPPHPHPTPLPNIQAQVFDDCSPIVDAVLHGFNGTIMAFGQTGSGKTHSLFGEISSARARGLVPRAVARLLQGADEMRCVDVLPLHMLWHADQEGGWGASIRRDRLLLCTWRGW